MADYRITVRTGSSDEPLYPLTGVNKGVNPTRGAVDVFETYPFGFAELYDAARLASARTHEGGFNVSNLFVVPGDLPPVAGVDYGAFDAVGDDRTDEWEDWRTDLVNVGDPRGEEMYLDPVLFTGVDGAYLYWYPSLLTDPAGWWSDACRDFEDSGVGEAYEALTGLAETEVYMRLGEGNRGPTYVGHPDGDDEDDVTPGRRGYAQVAAELVADLGSLGASPALPAFVEFWNETFNGPDTGDNEATAEDFAELFAEMRQALHDRVSPDVPVGGFGFSDGKRGDFANADPGEFDDLITQTLTRTAVTGTDIDFVSYHWYGTPLGTGAAGLDLVRQLADSMYEFAEDLQRTDERLDELFGGLYWWYSLPHPPFGVHLTEWGLRLPKEGEFDEFDVPGTGYNHLLGSPGAAFASAALTWMQDPDLALRVQRAHLWIGRGRRTGLFHVDRVAHMPTPAEADKEDVFFVRRPAAALFLHAGLDTLYWDDVEFRDLVPPAHAPTWWTGGPFDQRQAADQRLPVTALAGSDMDGIGEADHVAIVTNLGSTEAQIDLRFTGLPLGEAYHVLQRSLVMDEWVYEEDEAAWDFGPEYGEYAYIESRATDMTSPTAAGTIQGMALPATYEMAPDNTLGRVHVDPALAADLFESELIDASTSVHTVEYDRLLGETVLEVSITLSPFGVIRLDLGAYAGPAASGEISPPTGRDSGSLSTGVEDAVVGRDTNWAAQGARGTGQDTTAKDEDPSR